MKTTLITASVTLLMALTSTAQITLENTYAIQNDPRKSGLTAIKLEVSGDKYMLYDIKAKQIKLYNLDHSVYKTIAIPPLNKYRNSNSDSVVSIAHVSENLFNSDNLVEFVAFDGEFDSQLGTNSYSSMKVFNENGVTVFSGDSLMPCFKGAATYYGYETNVDFIFNTSDGAKMILFSYKNNTLSQKVYSLPGQAVATGIQKNADVKNALPFPNPTNNSITVPYKLTDGKQGKLVINDLQGKVLVEYVIDTAFENVVVDTNTMTAGNYFYAVYSSEKKVNSTGKFVVVK
jgi:type IX secretion system substrate protein